MSTYGYIRHDEMSGYAISHHGIKGQKWGIRRFQNPDGSLTSEGMRRYRIYSQHKQIANKKAGLSDKKYVNVGKSYEKKNGEYKRPKTRQDAIDIIKYDRDKSQKKGSGFGGTFYESGGILNPVHQLIYHYSDKNGNVALSYCRVPGQGDIYVKGSGNINDLDMNKLFKKPPKKIED